MEQNVFHVVFTDDAVAFMNTIPQSATDKIVATHGIIKKTQKMPHKEILKAETIRKEYFKNK